MDMQTLLVYFKIYISFDPLNQEAYSIVVLLIQSIHEVFINTIYLTVWGKRKIDKLLKVLFSFV